MGTPGRTGDTGSAGCRLRFVYLAERVSALAVSFLLLKSSLAHLANPYQFLSSVYAYQLVGPATGRWVAILLPTFQLVVAGCLTARLLHRESYVLAVLLFAGFVAVQILAIRRGLEVACGCFGGVGGDTVGPRTVAVAAGGLAASVIGLGLALWDRPRATDRPAPEEMPP